MSTNLQRLAFFAVGCMLALLLLGCGPELEEPSRLLTRNSGPECLQADPQKGLDAGTVTTEEHQQ